MFFSEKINYRISEYVASGHPDKIADQVSDALLDAYLLKDCYIRTAIECLISNNTLIIAGEVNDKNVLSNAEIDTIARNTLRRLGYSKNLLNPDLIKISILINSQSSEISNSVGNDLAGHKITGAGDQCLVFGFATNETACYMPSAIYFAKSIINNVMCASKTKSIPFTLGPDGKSQVVVKYKNGNPIGVNSALLSMQHPEGVELNELRNMLLPYILSSFPSNFNISDNSVIINPSQSFIVGGPIADCGLTGRKTAVDTYGSCYYNGGGAFSGKDPSKLDRSGAYMARYIAKNIVAAGLVRSCGVRLGYAIGISEPVYFDIETFGASAMLNKKIIEEIKNLVPLDPQGIVDYLGLLKPIYGRTAMNGHFGLDPDLDGGYSWERLDLSDSLAKKGLRGSVTMNVLPMQKKLSVVSTKANNSDMK
ncbi:methionine adenosyltransferase [Candidatus Xenohaliotis californiensis]